MPLKLVDGRLCGAVHEIAVIGPGIVGMPMAACMAATGIRWGSDRAARVTVVQRASASSGWKVDAINRGESVIGGVEPGLDGAVREAVAAGRLRATHRMADVAAADLVLVAVQTDRKGLGPDYGPLMEAIDALASALRLRPAGQLPVVVFESTLAPSSMTTVIRERFERFGLREGQDLLLGNSPNRVMPGRLLERIRESDKLVAGLHPATPRFLTEIYQQVVTQGRLQPTNSLTAEVVKTLENAYRDVRIAFAAEWAAVCEDQDLDFLALRDAVNARLAQTDAASSDPGAVPTGGLLLPMLGVGGHCLPKDGVLLWWRALEAGLDARRSLILRARGINDGAPGRVIEQIETRFGSLAGRRIALLGTAYRFDSEDTRNAPSLSLAAQLRARGAVVRLQDPHVRPDDPNLLRSGLADCFTRDLDAAVQDAEGLVLCVAHRAYPRAAQPLLTRAPQARWVFDAAHLWPRAEEAAAGLPVLGIGRGQRGPRPDDVDAVLQSFQVMAQGVSRELSAVIDHLNAAYAAEAFNRVDLASVRRLAATCPTGCDLPALDATLQAPGPPGEGLALVRTALGLGSV